MQFINTVLFAATALASMASANAVHFVNQDSTTRTIVFTAQEGLPTIDKLTVKGLTTGNVTFPTGWIGNFYSVSEGAKDVPGMLGEVRFDGFAGATYFDVSAIVNPDDVNGIKMLFPKNADKPVSGCQIFPCANAYNKWDDVQTLSTDDHELVCLIGNLSNERRRGHVARMSRDFITS
jgi:hypothetical protein